MSFLHSLYWRTCIQKHILTIYCGYKFINMSFVLVQATGLASFSPQQLIIWLRVPLPYQCTKEEGEQNTKGTRLRKSGHVHNCLIGMKFHLSILRRLKTDLRLDLVNDNRCTTDKILFFELNKSYTGHTLLHTNNTNRR